MRVTDHALVRYIERIAEIDLDLVRREIVAHALAGSKMIVVSDGAVVTILAPGMRRSRRLDRRAAYEMEAGL